MSRTGVLSTLILVVRGFVVAHLLVGGAGGVPMMPQVGIPSSLRARSEAGEYL